MNEFDQLVAECIALKVGNDEFLLRQDCPSGWRAGIGNPSSCVALGEVQPQFEASGATPSEAVRELVELLKRSPRNRAEPTTAKPHKRERAKR